MKKTKLFLSISGLCIALSVLVFGVFAATQVDYSISGQIIYEVTDAYVEVDTKIYASESYTGFSKTYDTAVALKSYVNLSQLHLVEYDVSEIVDDFTYNSLNSVAATCEFDDVALSGYYGYYFVITVKNLSEDVQVYMTANATSASNNVMVVSSGIVPSVTPGGSKIVVALMVDDPTVPIATQSYTLTVRCGSVLESSFELYEDDELGLYGARKKAGVTYSGVLVIPEEINGERVECLGDFSGLIDVTEIYVPESIISITEHCFEGSSNLQTLTVPFIGSDNTSQGAKVLGYLFTDEDPHDYNYYSAQQGYKKSKGTPIDYYYYLPCSLNKVTVTAANSIYGYDNHKTNREWYGAFTSTHIETAIISSDSVTKFNEMIFSGCSLLKHVYIPSNVNVIDSNCFKGCTVLAKVDIPSSVQTIKTNYDNVCEGAFDETLFLNNLFRNGMAIATSYDNNSVRYLIGVAIERLPSKITEEMLFGVVEIPYKIFYESEITEIGIPSSVKTISDFAFSCCDELTKVTMQDGVEYVGNYTFKDCTALTSLTIPASVTEIGESIFSGCASLEELTLPFIGKKNYSSYNELDTLEEGNILCASIGYMFGIDSKSTDYFISVECDACGYGNVTSVVNYYLPKSLTKITLLEGCLCLNSFALLDYVCDTPITTIVLPSTITRIEECAFGYCDKEFDIIINSEIPPTLDSGAIREYDDVVVHVPYSAVSDYQDADYWENLTIVGI